MKKKVFVFLLFLMSTALASCSNSNEKISFNEALAILKKIDRQINYTPITNIPTSYILKEEISSYLDDDKEIKNVTIDREINQDDHYSYFRIKGTYKEKPYVHENWTYVTDKKNVACNYINYKENEKTIVKRYRQESERSLENWDSFAQNDVSEMQRLYARMAKEFYTYLSSMEGEIEDVCSSFNDSSVKIEASNEKMKYACEFSDNWFTSGRQEDIENGAFYGATVSWNKCDISMPNLDYYTLIDEK